MTTINTNHIFEHMRYKQDFVGLNQKEDRYIIDYLIRATASPIPITENEKFLIHKSIRVMMDNKEFKRGTFEDLLRLFYAKLGFLPIPFHKGKNGRGEYYRTHEVKDIEEIARRMSRRMAKRKAAFEWSYHDVYHETIDWESIIDLEERKRELKENLGDLVKDISQSMDPRDCVILPFRKN